MAPTDPSTKVSFDFESSTIVAITLDSRINSKKIPKNKNTKI